MIEAFDVIDPVDRGISLNQISITKNWRKRSLAKRTVPRNFSTKLHNSFRLPDLIFQLIALTLWSANISVVIYSCRGRHARFSIPDSLRVSIVLIMEFEEVRRLLLVGSLSLSDPDSDRGVTGLAISLPLCRVDAFDLVEQDCFGAGAYDL
nr:hypothetical protein [Tanacetum cinerariifolium]